MTSHELETTLEKVSRIITDRYGLRLVCCRAVHLLLGVPPCPSLRQAAPGPNIQPGFVFWVQVSRG